jgi:hypothetical protein
VKIGDHTLICHDFSDALLLNHHRLKSMDATPHTDHHSVFKWIWQKKPLDNGEFNWIFHPGDFVSMISPRKNRFENSIRRYLHSSAPALKFVHIPLPNRHNTHNLALTELLQINKPGARNGRLFGGILLSIPHQQHSSPRRDILRYLTPPRTSDDFPPGLDEQTMYDRCCTRLRSNFFSCYISIL